jgi:hypothetical protein
MATTYEPIATASIGTGGASFTSIPNTYTDLRLVVVAAGDGGTTQLRINLNNDSNFIYSFTTLSGNGSTASSARATDNSRWSTGLEELPGSSTGFGLTILDLFSYAGSTNKTALWEASGDRNGSGLVVRQVCIYNSTSAINRIDILATSRNYASGSTATLYGILKA